MKERIIILNSGEKEIQIFGMTIFIYENIKREVQNKLTNLYVYHTTYNSNYYTALAQGLAQVQDGRGFNRKTGIFNTKELDLSWIVEDTGTRIKEPNREGFASYYGSIMIEKSEFRDEQLASHEYYLPDSKEVMDEMFERMSEDGIE